MYLMNLQFISEDTVLVSGGSTLLSKDEVVDSILSNLPSNEDVTVPIVVL